ncbi:ABC transporter, ATP-binding protein [Formosa agariphila KMM 3901]|uniref:ABC transporter, ATP-binding protein n=1 Tax=Formosa agariphila (strain DSM 15362 / KCTC 12365 / LMG 23005 / KMM 3901 / M-2Alg 35-1) TaxID=1347342 RepID=T2KJ05_FORAG|nr:ABC transporter ATP-binding protein [Formosa agariphila]CDF78775.1 ABC transporter, ATP-binding protein [Formosa agariphila KMM 3901]
MILSATDLCKSYGKLQVLKSVSIQCKAGEICGVLGANGAGKTTLFKIILGLVKPNSGTVNLEAQGIKPIGGIIEKPALYEYLNAYDNLNLFCKIQGLKVSKGDILNRLLQVGLPIDRTDPVRNFSMGMKQRLGISIALLNNPKCLVLDEPFSGLDPLGISALRKLIIDLAEKEQLAILISSHIIEELSKICNTMYVMKQGEIIKSGLAQDIILENTTSFSFSAPNIKLSEALKHYDVMYKGEIAHVTITTNQVPKLIQELADEQIFITSCVPELDMDKLFQ